MMMPYKTALKVSTFYKTILYSDCLRRESNFLASTRPITALCELVCCIVCVCDYVKVMIMQHAHTHKAVTERVEAKKLLSRQRQSNYSFIYETCSDKMSNTLPVDQRRYGSLNISEIIRKLRHFERNFWFGTPNNTATLIYLFKA